MQRGEAGDHKAAIENKLISHEFFFTTKLFLFPFNLTFLKAMKIFH